MYPAVGNRKFVEQSLSQLSDQLRAGTPEVSAAIGAALGSNDPSAIESQRAAISDQISKATEMVTGELSHQDAHFVSQFDLVGLFQAVLSKFFCDIPDFQGYGDKNPTWLATIIEQVTSADAPAWSDAAARLRYQGHSLCSVLFALKSPQAPSTMNGTGCPGKAVFTGRLRDECLNTHWFRNLWEARRRIQDWRREYNTERPHSSLDYRTPHEFALIHSEKPESVLNI